MAPQVTETCLFIALMLIIEHCDSYQLRQAGSYHILCSSVMLRDKSQHTKQTNEIRAEKVSFPAFPLEIHFLESR